MPLLLCNLLPSLLLFKHPHLVSYWSLTHWEIPVEATSVHGNTNALPMPGIART